MEETTFKLPAVAGVLTRNYVEARLHTDHPDDAIRERNLALQAEFQGSLATPYYFVLDPSDASVLDEFAGASFDSEVFKSFLKDAADRARDGERVARAAD